MYLNICNIPNLNDHLLPADVKGVADELITRYPAGWRGGLLDSTND